jgi:hypothetical protein
VKTQADRQRAALKRIAADDTELASRLILMTLPASGRAVTYVLEVDGLGEHHVGEGEPAFRLKTDPRTLVDLATGSSPIGLMLRGRRAGWTSPRSSTRAAHSTRTCSTARWPTWWTPTGRRGTTSWSATT